MSLSYLVDTLTEASPEFFTLRPGYTNLDLDIAKTLECLRKGPLKNTFILLDLCAPYQKAWSYYLELLPYVDAIHGNSKEIVKVAGGGTLEHAADKVFALGANCVLLTKEADGAELLTKHHRIRQPAFQIQFIEPSGCGDAFCAGIILGLSKTGKTLSESSADELAEVLIQGQVLGAAAATAVGCVEGVTREKVEELLSQQKSRILAQTSKEVR
jgi:sugar/nucleoside kinase (ribokinase family)